MIAENSSESEDDFEILYNVVSVLLIEQDMVTKITDAEEEYFPEDMVDHKPVCYYVMNDGCVEEQNAIFEKSDIGMKSHLKPLFIRASLTTLVLTKSQLIVVQQLT